MKLLLSLTLLIVIANQASAKPNIPLQKDVDPPALLSQTGVYQGDVTLLQPAPGFTSFEIIQPLFVDHAQKQRMFYLPDNTHAGFSPTEAYAFPVGAVMVKHFPMEVSRGVLQNLETRILVRKEGDNQQNWVGYTYKWNGQDANLVDATSSPQLNLSVDATAPGGARQQVFKIPNRRQCLQCHNSSVGFVRGLETRQLNRLVGGINQLDALNAAGIFDHDIGPAQAFESYAAIDNSAEPLEKRVKTYVAVNCSHCHNPDPAAMCSFTGLDFRYSNFSVDAIVASGHIVKHDKNSSPIFLRMDSVIPGFRMPFIGAALKDDSALDVVGRWIDQL